jgi:hypothetical protein
MSDQESEWLDERRRLVLDVSSRGDELALQVLGAIFGVIPTACSVAGWTEIWDKVVERDLAWLEAERVSAEAKGDMVVSSLCEAGCYAAEAMAAIGPERAQHLDQSLDCLTLVLEHVLDQKGLRDPASLSLVFLEYQNGVLRAATAGAGSADAAEAFRLTLEHFLSTLPRR